MLKPSSPPLSAAPGPPVVALLHLLGRSLLWAVRHLIARCRHAPVKGACWLAWLFQSGAWLIQALPARPRFSIPGAPATTGIILRDHLAAAAIEIGVLFVMVALVDLIPIWPFTMGWRVPVPPLPAAPPAPPPEPDYRWEELLLGQRYTRTWDSATRSFTVEPKTDLARLTAPDLRRNGLVLAPQDSGKTFSVLLPIVRWLRRTRQVVVFLDRKGDGVDAGLFTHTLNVAESQSSFSWNIYGYGSPAEAAALLAEALMPWAESERGSYFAGFCRTALRILVVAHHAASLDRVGGTPSLPTLNELYTYLQHGSARDGLARRLPETHPARKDLLGLEDRIKRSNDALGQLLNDLDAVTHHPISACLVGPGQGPALIDLLNTPGCGILFALWEARYPRVAAFLARLALAQYHQAVHDSAMRTDYLKLMLVDDAAPYLTPAVVASLATARYRESGYLFALQSLTQIPETTRDTVVGTTGLFLLLRGVDLATALYFEGYFGQGAFPITRRQRSTTEGRSIGATTSASAQRPAGWLSEGPATAGTQRGATQSTSRAATVGEEDDWELRPFWRASDIQRLPPRHGLLALTRAVPAADPATPPTSGLVDFDTTLLAMDRVPQSPLAALERSQHLEAWAAQTGWPCFDPARFPPPDPVPAPISLPAVVVPAPVAVIAPAAAEAAPDAPPPLPARLAAVLGVGSPLVSPPGRMAATRGRRSRSRPDAATSPAPVPASGALSQPAGAPIPGASLAADSPDGVCGPSARSEDAPLGILPAPAPPDLRNAVASPDPVAPAAAPASDDTAAPVSRPAPDSPTARRQGRAESAAQGDF